MEFRGSRHGVSSFGDRDMEFQSFGDHDMEHQDISSQELSKPRNAEMRNCDMEFWGSQHGVSGICDMSKSRNDERDYCESRRLEGKNVEIPSAVRLRKEGIRL
jgi:hypothetical protein